MNLSFVFSRSLVGVQRAQARWNDVLTYSLVVESTNRDLASMRALLPVSLAVQYVALSNFGISITLTGSLHEVTNYVSETGTSFRSSHKTPRRSTTEKGRKGSEFHSQWIKFGSAL